MIENNRGMVMQESICEIIHIDAASVVSLPYAAGITTVLSPSGIAIAQAAQRNIVLSIGTK